MNHIQDNAANIVRLLLEEAPVQTPLERACAACEREFGVHNPNASHGLCKRHYLETYRTMKQTPSVVRNTQDIQARPDSDFPPDLAKQNLMRT